MSATTHTEAGGCVHGVLEARLASGLGQWKLPFGFRLVKQHSSGCKTAAAVAMVSMLPACGTHRPPRFDKRAGNQDPPEAIACANMALSGPLFSPAAAPAAHAVHPQGCSAARDPSRRRRVAAGAARRPPPPAPLLVVPPPLVPLLLLLGSICNRHACTGARRWSLQPSKGVGGAPSRGQTLAGASIVAAVPCAGWKVCGRKQMNTAHARKSPKSRRTMRDQQSLLVPLPACRHTCCACARDHLFLAVFCAVVRLAASACGRLPNHELSHRQYAGCGDPPRRQGAAGD